MARVCVFLLLNLLCFMTSSAQNVVKVKEIPLEVSDVKWVYLKFAAAVSYADMGTDEITVEVTNVNSVVRVKSEVSVFDETSITIITTDGKVYTFSLSYKQNPRFVAASVINRDIADQDIILPMEIELSHKRTSHIILPSKILDVKAGCDSIIAEQVENIENIVKCKSLSVGFDFFDETDLVVITEDKQIYPFIVKYSENPEILNFTVAGGDVPDAVFSSISVNEMDMRRLGEKVVSEGSMLNHGVIDNKMIFSLRSIFVEEDVFMFHLSIVNNSHIDYEIDFLKSYIVNKKTAKAQAYQIDEKVPLFVYGNGSEDDVVAAKQERSVVLFFKRFTIPDKHSLYFEVFEKNGGRHLKFTVPNKELLKARRLKDG